MFKSTAPDRYAARIVTALVAVAAIATGALSYAVASIQIVA